MKELIEKWVGKTVHVRLGGLTVKVKVKDVKITWGKERFLVTPTDGEEEIWVETIYEITNK